MAGSASLLGSAFASTSATTIDVSVTLTVGRKYAIGVIGADVGSTVSAADTLSNSYTHRGSVVEAAIARRHHGLTCAPTTGGSTTITITYPSSADNRQVYVWEIQDVGDYDAFGTATDTGNNPTTAATATNSAQPAFLLATSIFYQGGTPTVGTIGGSAGVDEGTIFVGSGMLIGRGESQSVTSVGSQSANFGNSAFDRSTTLLWIFLESAPPTISAQPTDQTANAGATATFSVTATGGVAPYTYQWQDDSGGSFANISGATSSSYTTAAATYAMQGRRYRCVVTGANSLSVTSDPAALRVAFNLSGTGPRAYPSLGGGPIGAGTVEAWLRGTDAGGAPSHSTTGALTAQDATLAGTATHLTLHATTGALSAQASTVSGAAQHQHATTGALSAQAATIAGTATHLTLHTTTGALAAQASTVTGVAAHQHATAGALAAQAATISGAADHTTAGASHATSGDLVAQAAALAGSATHLTLHSTSGALSAQAATVAGSAAHQHATTGALSAQESTIAGSAAHATLHTTSGALGAQAATVAGSAAHEHATSGALSADAASIAGSAVHTTVGVHIASGALEAQPSQMAGAALLVAVTPAASPGKDGASPYKKWRYYADDQPNEEPKPRKPDAEPPAVVVQPAPTKPRAPVSAGELLRTVQTMAEQRRAITAELERQETAQRQTMQKASQARASAEQAAAVAIAMAQAEALEQEIEDDDQEAIALAVSLLDL